MAVGKPAPNWSCPDVRGGAPRSLQALRGKLVLLDFWATWCSACESLLEQRLAPLHRKYAADARFELVSLGVPWNDETAAKQAAFSKAKDCSWTQVFDAKGEAALDYGLRGIPFLCLVDETGTILAYGSGWRVIDAIERILIKRLRKVEPDPKPQQDRPQQDRPQQDRPQPDRPRPKQPKPKKP
jgi:thiol-disulfide isomerase/thioredoxin